MIDSLNFTLIKDFNSDKASAERIFKQFSDEPLLNKEKYTRLPYLGGNIRNLSIKVFENQLKVDGSLSAFYLGNNQHVLDYKGCLQALQKLEEVLDLNILGAKVRRVDLAQNLLMENPPEVYYPLLIKGGIFDRIENTNGIYFRNKSRKVLIYNKNTERKDKKKAIHPVLGDHNVLRYEFSIISQQALKYHLKKKKVLLSDIITDYKTLIELWHESYRLIAKDISFEVPQSIVFSTPTEYINHLAILGIKSMGGYSEVVKAIHQAKDQKVFKYSGQVSILKKRVKDLIGSIEHENMTLVYLREFQQKLDEARDFAIFNSN